MKARVSNSVKLYRLRIKITAHAVHTPHKSDAKINYALTFSPQLSYHQHHIHVVMTCHNLLGNNSRQQRPVRLTLHHLTSTTTSPYTVVQPILRNNSTTDETVKITALQTVANKFLAFFQSVTQNMEQTLSRIIKCMTWISSYSMSNTQILVEWQLRSF